MREARAGLVAVLALLGCARERAPDPVQVSATGPGWRVAVTSRAMRWDAEAGRAAVFPAIPPRRDGEARVFEGRRSMSDSVFMLRVGPGPCRSPDGRRHPWRAEVRWGATRGEGCAGPGTREGA